LSFLSFDPFLPRDRADLSRLELNVPGPPHHPTTETVRAEAALGLKQTA